MKSDHISFSVHSIVVIAVILICIATAGVHSVEFAYAAASATDVKTNEGVVDGYIYFDESTGTITDCDESVTKVDIPEEINGVTVKIIGSSAFYGCSEISGITLPESLESIEASAFAHCESLTEITIPAGVTYIGDAFGSCTKLEYICVDENNTKYMSKEGVLFNKTDNGEICGIVVYPEGNTRTEYTIPDGVRTIYHLTFVDNIYLETVVIPEGIKTINQSVFRGCKKLKEVTLPQTLEGIDSCAFSNCINLKSIVIPVSVTEIAEDAFDSCTDLVIYGEYDSYAEEYAIAYDIPFESASGYRAEQTVTGSSSISKTYGCSPFTLDLSAKTELTYESSNKDVATVSDEGVVTVTGGGTAVITATAVQTERYESAAKKITLTVGQASQTISGVTAISKTYGCGAFFLGATARTGLSYESSNTGVAEVLQTGKVTIKSGGTATITVTAAESKDYKSDVKKITLTVDKAPQAISGSTSFSKTCKSGAFYLGAAAKTGMTYSSGNTDVATVSPSGEVTVKNTGTAVITINAEETEKYKAATKKVTVSVGKASQTITGKNSFSKTYGCRAFSLGASANTRLTYKSSNTKIATVSPAGKVTFKNPGKATITVTAKSSSKYKSAVKKVKVSSKLKKPTLTAKALNGRKIKLTWGQVPGATGYKIYIYDAETKEYVCRLTKSSNVKSVVHKGLKTNKKYCYKVRAYRTADGKNVYSSYSASKKVKAKK